MQHTYLNYLGYFKQNKSPLGCGLVLVDIDIALWLHWKEIVDFMDTCWWLDIFIWTLSHSDLSPQVCVSIVCFRQLWL